MILIVLSWLSESVTTMIKLIGLIIISLIIVERFLVINGASQ